MPQSFANNFVHIVFSTKHRQPFLYDGIRDRMFVHTWEVFVINLNLHL